MLLLGGCSRQASRVETGVRDKVLHWGNGSEPGTLDPNLQSAAIEATIGGALFEGLTNIAIDGTTIVPGVAEHWDISADQRTYTFHLRADARWSDGSAVTAQDFAFSFQRECEPSMGCQQVDTGFAIAGVSDYVAGRSHSVQSLGFRALDARTFEVRLNHPAPYILTVLGESPWFPVPEAVVRRFGAPFDPASRWSRPENLVGNGPFELKSWQPNANVTVVRNPLYWDRAHLRLNEVRFYPTDNTDAEERGFRSGQLHLTYRVPLSKIAAYKNSPDGSLRVSPQAASWMVVFNTRRVPFDRPEVRRAFSLAIDRERLVPNVLHETGTPAQTLTRPGIGGISFPAVRNYDPDGARKLLADAGYPGGAGLPPLTLTVRSAGTDPLLAEVLQQSWQKELGARVQIKLGEPKVVINSLYSHDFEFAITGWFYGVNSAEFVLTMAHAGSPANMADWRNAEFERNFSAAENATSPSQYAAAIRGMEIVLFAEVPYAPIYYFNQTQLVHPTLHGWQGNLIQQTDWRALSLSDPP